MKQIDKKYLCYTCYGCNRLELETFQGVYRCKNYIKGAKENEQVQKQKSTN
jgi:hypothetical protein